MSECEKIPCENCGSCKYVCRYCGRDMSGTIGLLGTDAWAVHLQFHINEEMVKIISEAAHELDFGADAVAVLLSDDQAHRVRCWKDLAKKCRKIIGVK